MHHSDFIANFITAVQAKSYLELGLYHGETITKVANNNPQCLCTGVDMNPLTFLPVFRFYQSTSDDFWKQNQDTYDVIFIDADHSYESVLRDLNKALGCLNAHGLILLHDTNPNSVHLIDPGYCGDCFRLNTRFNDLNLDFVTLPIAEAGLTILQRKGDIRSARFMSE